MRNENYSKTSIKPFSGFTIIELLVVIAVLGILATISIVGYGSWRSSTNVAQIKSDLNGLVAAMEDARNFGSGYPATIPSTFKPTAGTTVAGGSMDGKNYCVSATVGGIMYRIKNTSPAPELTTLGCIYSYTQTASGLSTWTAPSYLSNGYSIRLEVWGQRGGNSTDGNAGGSGGYSSGYITVNPNDVLNLAINTGGGGPGSSYYDSCVGYGGGGYGGGASDVRVGGTALTNRVIVAGGGGGASGDYGDCGGGYGYGGSSWGGGLTSGSNTATQTSGNALGVGANGSGEGGGGGGGYYGGTSSDGGSGYIGGVTNGITTANAWSGNGKVTISFYYP